MAIFRIFFKHRPIQQMKFIFYLLLSSCFISLGCSDDDPSTIIETITVRDTITVIQHDTTIISHLDTIIIIERDTIVEVIPEDSSVVIICVRHAETAGGGSNPNLSTAGIVRAEDLAHALSNFDLSTVYSSNFNRTRQTAQPTADSQGHTTEIYNAFNIPGFANDLRSEHRGQSVLVVGHSNTTPELINALSQTTSIPTFNENTYDNLYIVHLKIDGSSIIYHLEYGEDTP